MKDLILIPFVEYYTFYKNNSELLDVEIYVALTNSDAENIKDKSKKRKMFLMYIEPCDVKKEMDLENFLNGIEDDFLNENSLTAAVYLIEQSVFTAVESHIENFLEKHWRGKAVRVLKKEPSPYTERYSVKIIYSKEGSEFYLMQDNTGKLPEDFDTTELAYDAKRNFQN